jgi:hypothetical protein
MDPLFQTLQRDYAFHNAVTEARKALQTIIDGKIAGAQPPAGACEAYRRANPGQPPRDMTLADAVRIATEIETLLHEAANTFLETSPR